MQTRWAPRSLVLYTTERSPITPSPTNMWLALSGGTPRPQPSRRWPVITTLGRNRLDRRMKRRSGVEQIAPRQIVPNQRKFQTQASGKASRQRWQHCPPSRHSTSGMDRVGRHASSFGQPSSNGRRAGSTEGCTNDAGKKPAAHRSTSQPPAARRSAGGRRR